MNRARGDTMQFDQSGPRVCRTQVDEMPIHRRLFFRLAVPGACLFVTLSAVGPLDIYFIDVEGGQSTLVVTSTGESLLVDTGYAGNNGRDANRIAAAARTAGLKQIDYLLLTHFHGDHRSEERRVGKESSPRAVTNQ